MAYDGKELLKQSLKIIETEEVVFIEELVSYLPCDKKTFYTHKLHENPDIKAAMTKNKVSKKAKLRKKWFDSENATLQVALYKLLANEEELERLQNTKASEQDKNLTINIVNRDE